MPYFRNYTTTDLAVTNNLLKRRGARALPPKTHILVFVWKATDPPTTTIDTTTDLPFYFRRHLVLVYTHY
jgi:hypothetical protein